MTPFLQYAFFLLLLTASDVAWSATNTTFTSPAPFRFRSDGFWIWADQTADRQPCHFWRAINIPRDASVVEAHLRMAVDNSYILFLDGRKLGQGSEWRTMTDYDLTWVLTPGTHVLAVETFNEYAEGGFFGDLFVEFKDGTSLRVVTDPDWRIVPETESGWHKRKEPRRTWANAKVIAGFGDAPWKQLGRIIRVPVQPLNLQFWQTGWFQISLISVITVIGIVCLRLMAQLAVQRKAQQVLHAERTRVAQDFHDDLGARLTQVVLLGELAQRELPPETKTRAQIDQICERVRDLSGAVNEIIWMVNSVAIPYPTLPLTFANIPKGSCAIHRFVVVSMWEWICPR